MLVIAIRNLRRQLRRTILTALTVALATFIFTILVSVPASMDRIIDDAAKGLRLIVTAPNAYKLPVRYREAIKGLPHVTACAAEIQWGAIYQDLRDPIIAFGVDSDVGLVYSDAEYQLPPDAIETLSHDRRNAMIGSVLMREHKWHLGQQIMLRNPGDPNLTLTFIPVVEVPAKHAPNAFIFRRELLDEAVKKRYGVDITDRASFLAVRVDRPENISLVIDEIDSRFHNSEAETETLTESDAIANGMSALGNVRGIIYSLCAVVLMTVLLVAANSLAMMVRERVSEVAVMRALGFGRGHVAIMLLGEAAMIGGIGAAAGAAMARVLFGGGITLGAVVGGAGYMEVRPEVALEGFIVAVAITFLSAAIPVIGALRIRPALAFRQVV